MKDRTYLLDQLRHRDWIEAQLRHPSRREVDATLEAKVLELRCRQPDWEDERETCKKCAA